MPDLRIPIRSGVHRVAAIALYRALLAQCRAVPLNVAQRDELQNIVRNRFKNAQRSHSPRLLRVSFEAGYEAIDHLDAAVAGNEESREYITSLLGRAPAKIKLPPVRKASTEKSIKKKVAPESDHEELQQPRTSIFDRPLPLEQLSGKRHIPVLVNANQIPILRFKKPQPASLSHYISSRIIRRQKRTDHREELAELRSLASMEDKWDDLVRAPSQQSVGRVMTRSDYNESSWVEVVDIAIKKVEYLVRQEHRNNQMMAEKMQAVVDRETELAETEKAERQRVKRREKHRKWQANRAARQRNAGDVGGQSVNQAIE